MVVNASREFLEAQRKYLEAKTDEERLAALEEMLKFMPKHKGAESLRANLRARYAKLKAKLEEKRIKQKALKKGKSISIEKQGIQVCIYGIANSGKSLLLSLLTNAKPRVSEIPYTTIMPEIGMLNYKEVDFQLIEFPSLYLNLFEDKQWLSYAITTDLILILARKIDDANLIVSELFDFNEKIKDKPILILINSIGSNEIKREKFTFETKDKKIRKVIDLISCDILKNKEIIKEIIFSLLPIFRIYLKKPESKEPERKPLVFLKSPTVTDIIDKIKKSKEKLIKVKVYGKSVKFNGQIVSLNHQLLDGDVVEFYFKKY
ncbi:MAG: GTPase [Candidatus Pacearchaeota archaeon]